MISIREYLDAPLPPEVDWTVHPWAAAYPLLKFLGRAPEVPDHSSQVRALSGWELDLLCSKVADQFVSGAGLSWSSFRMEQALTASSHAAQGPPEALLQAVWRMLADKPLDENCWNFCHSLGIATLGRWRKTEGWDLSWMLDAESDSQRSLRYWIIGVRPELWSSELEEESIAAFANYPFARM